MTLTGTQKKYLVFFFCTLAPAYWLADWRHTVSLTAIHESYTREQSLHISTDKLIKNCEQHTQREGASFDASHQICKQGLNIHAQTAQQMDALEQEKLTNDGRRYRNFVLYVGIFNLIGFIAFKFRHFVKEE